jgi:hypothetical protein
MEAFRSKSSRERSFTNRSQLCERRANTRLPAADGYSIVTYPNTAAGLDMGNSARGG